MSDEDAWILSEGENTHTLNDRHTLATIYKITLAEEIGGCVCCSVFICVYIFITYMHYVLLLILQKAGWWDTGCHLSVIFCQWWCCVLDDGLVCTEGKAGPASDVG